VSKHLDIIATLGPTLLSEEELVNIKNEVQLFYALMERIVLLVMRIELSSAYGNIVLI